MQIPKFAWRLLGVSAGAFAVTFTILVAILLALMNTYPTRASRDIVFTEKQSALTNRAAVVSSSLSLLDNLTPDNTRQVLALLDLRDLMNNTGKEGLHLAGMGESWQAACLL